MSNPLRQALNDYLRIRRALGFELRYPGHCLGTFVAFAAEQGASRITTDLAVRWAKHPPDGDPANWARRLGMVRQFARWHATVAPRTEVPPTGLIPHRYRRKRPYIYGDEEIALLVEAAGRLPSYKGLRGHTYATVFGLLAATGMRVSEAVALDQHDVDLDAAILTIRRTKFAKSRVVPVHVSTRDALQAYAAMRDRIVPQTTLAFFLSERATRITPWGARYNFAKVSRDVGLRAPAGGYRHGHGPRLHDLRHHFAAKTLIDWYRDGRDVERELPKLSTYLGHVHVGDTYWYIEAVPELLHLATQRLVNPHEGVPS